MTDRPERHILLFSHHSQAASASRLKSEIENLQPEEFDISVKLLDDSSRFQEADLDPFGAYIIIYTSELAKNENLYRMIKYFEAQGDMQRFFILPQQEDGMVPLPSIFHTIRAQQHHIYGYRLDESSEAIDFSPFGEGLLQDISQHLWQMEKVEKVSAAQEPETFRDKAGRYLKSRQGKTLLIMLPIFIALVLAIIYLIPILIGNMQNDSVVFDPSMKPQTSDSFWLDEGFHSMDDLDTWEIINQHKGKNFLYSYTLSDQYMTVYANEDITEAQFKLQGRGHWPLDELNAVQSTFQLEAAQNAEVVLAYKVVLTGNDAYSFGCDIRPLMKEGHLECFITDPQKQEKVTIPYPETLNLNEWHSLTIEFNPTSYALRFFLDDTYFGQAAIPSVEQWKSQDFNAVIQVNVDNLQESPFSIKIKRFQLTCQDQ